MNENCLGDIFNSKSIVSVLQKTAKRMGTFTSLMSIGQDTHMHMDQIQTNI